MLNNNNNNNNNFGSFDDKDQLIKFLKEQIEKQNETINYLQNQLELRDIIIQKKNDKK